MQTKSSLAPTSIPAHVGSSWLNDAGVLFEDVVFFSWQVSFIYLILRHDFRILMCATTYDYILLYQFNSNSLLLKSVRTFST